MKLLATISTLLVVIAVAIIDAATALPVKPNLIILPSQVLGQFVHCRGVKPV